MVTHTRKGLRLALFAGVVLYVALSALFATSFSQGANNRNVSVDTRVNITQSYPEILSVIVAPANITLNAGTSKIVDCNITARDYNGGSTINATATLFHNATTVFSDPDDNNTHYANGSCTATATDGFYRNFTCSFPVMYYANIGIWTCRVNVTDDYNFSVSDTNYTHIDQLLALNVTTLIDYGDLAVGDTSQPQEANVTNLGNTNINVTVKGYGQTLDDGLSFVCQVGNISIQHEKFNVSNGGQVLTHYVNLSSTLTQIPYLSVLQQTNDSQQVVNSTYWLLYVPPNPFGECNGTVIFQAERSA